MHNIFSNSPIDVLVVDDEAFVLDTLRLFLEGEGCNVRVASCSDQALSEFAEREPEVALVDVRMPGGDGLQLLKKLKARHSDVEIIMATGCSSLEIALEAMRLGAYDYVTKPIVDLDNDLLRVVEKAAERFRLRRSNRSLNGDLQVAKHEVRSAAENLDRQQGPWREVATTMRAVATLDGSETVELLFNGIISSSDCDQFALLQREGDSLTLASSIGFGNRSEFESLPCHLFPDPTEKWRMGPTVASGAEIVTWMLPLFLAGRIEGLIILADSSGKLPDPALAEPLRALADLSTLLLLQDGPCDLAPTPPTDTTCS